MIKTPYTDFSIKFATDFNHTIKICYYYTESPLYTYTICSAIQVVTLYNKPNTTDTFINFNEYFRSDAYTKSPFSNNLIELIHNGFEIKNFCNLVSEDNVKWFGIILNKYNNGNESISTTHYKNKSLYKEFRELLYKEFRESVYKKFIENNVLITPLRMIVIEYLI